MLKAKLSSKGQIRIPKAVREKLDLREGTEVSILVQGQNVILQKIVPRDWRRWSGRFPNSGLLEALEKEHRDEVLLDA
jgi:AbrB family looped-hinge helix DNA binding protein